jgi:hypothetical protein
LTGGLCPFAGLSCLGLAIAPCDIRWTPCALFLTFLRRSSTNSQVTSLGFTGLPEKEVRRLYLFQSRPCLDCLGALHYPSICCLKLTSKFAVAYRLPVFCRYQYLDPKITYRQRTL